MGNICPWCRKNPEDLESIDHRGTDSNVSQSQRTLNSAGVTDETPLLFQQHNHSGIPASYSATVGVGVSTTLTDVVPPPPPPVVKSNHSDTSSEKVLSNETADASMTIIVERMLPDLIDVGGWGNGTHQTGTNGANVNAQNDHWKQLLSKSFQSANLPSLPDAGTSNLSTLLSGRAISADICHFVAHTAGELSRLLIDEIKIVHKEDLVVTFE